MATPAIGSVVLVRFPFSDLSDSKLRPAFVLADVGRGDYLLSQITSREYSDSTAIELSDDHFKRGSLKRRSFIRPDKLFTANQTLIVREVGVIKLARWQTVVDSIELILRRDMPTE